MSAASTHGLIAVRAAVPPGQEAPHLRIARGTDQARPPHYSLIVVPFPPGASMEQTRTVHCRTAFVKSQGAVDNSPTTQGLCSTHTGLQKRSPHGVPTQPLAAKQPLGIANPLNSKLRILRI